MVEGRPFAVADSVYCCWDPDHRARTLEFLEGIDPDYFSTVAGLLAQQLESDDAVAASVALRVLYHQGVETLMTLLGAVVQGPRVVPAWIAKCSTGDLKIVARRLQTGQPLLTEVGEQRVTFDLLSAGVHRFAWTDEDGPTSTAVKFGQLWHRLASELLDETARDEYNALKHGSRVLPGGFTMAVGTEEAFGVPVPPEQMRSMGGSKFGSTFFVTEPLGSTKWHLRTRRTSLNWLPEPLGQRLALISVSIANVVGALRCGLGVDATTISFVRPESPESFDVVWSRSPGVTSSNMDYVFGIDPSDELSRDELRSLLEDGDEDD